MKRELERILAMTKAGTIDEAQAAQLIEALQDKGAAPARESGGFWGDMADAMRSAVGSISTNTVTGVLASELQENSLSMSRIRLLDARGHTFRGNTVSMSSIERLSLSESEFTNNVLRSTSFEEGQLTGARLSGCQFTSGSLDGITIDRSSLERTRLSSSSIDSLTLLNETVFEDVGIRSSSLKNVKAVKSTVSNLSITGTHLNGLSLEDSELREGQLGAAHVADVTLTRSKWITTFVRELRLNRVRVLDSTFNDVLLAGSEGWRKRGLEDTTFAHCQLEKIVFSDCRFQSVTIKNVTVRDLTLQGVELRDVVLDGTDAFLEAIAEPRRK